MNSKNADPVLPEVAAVAREVDRLVKLTGKGPKQIVKAEGKAFSEATISRCRRGVGNNLPNDTLLAALFKHAHEPEDGQERVKALVAEARQAKSAAGSGEARGSTKVATARKRPPCTGRRRGRRAVLTVVGIAVVTAALALGVVRVLGDDGDDVPPAAPGVPAAGGVATPSRCDRYEVKPGVRDLSLRDESGTVTGQEIPGGHKLTILSWRSTSGPPTNWHARTDDGLTGWVDYRYLDPLC